MALLLGHPIKTSFAHREANGAVCGTHKSIRKVKCENVLIVGLDLSMLSVKIFASTNPSSEWQYLSNNFFEARD